MVFLDFVPGFRSSTLWKGVIAVLYYIFSIYYFIHTWAMLLFLLSAPFMFFSFIELLGIYEVGHSMIISRNIFMVSFILVIISSVGVFHSFFNLKALKRRVKLQILRLIKFKSSFLSIGQADSILIQQANKNILIDGGYHISSRPILRYLKRYNVEKLDYLIVTHPHNDHIGGLPRIFESIHIENIIINNKNPYEIKKNYKMHKNLLELARILKINLIHPVPGDTYDLGEGNFTILAPNGSGYDRINDYSIVIKYIYEDISILFAGDAEKISEKEILKNNSDVKADVLKVGHHGSCTSSSEEFINAVSPKYAIISVGWCSFYGQPDKCVLDRLYNVGAKLYRTDKLGTVILKSNGKNIKFNKEPVSYPKVKIPYTSVRLKYKNLHGEKNLH